MKKNYIENQYSFFLRTETIDVAFLLQAEKKSQWSAFYIAIFLPHYKAFLQDNWAIQKK